MTYSNCFCTVFNYKKKFFFKDLRRKVPKGMKIERKKKGKGKIGKKQKERERESYTRKAAEADMLLGGRISVSVS